MLQSQVPSILGMVSPILKLYFNQCLSLTIPIKFCINDTVLRTGPSLQARDRCSSGRKRKLHLLSLSMKMTSLKIPDMATVNTRAPKLSTLSPCQTASGHRVELNSPRLFVWDSSDSYILVKGCTICSKLVHLFLVPVQPTTREMCADDKLVHNNDSTGKRKVLFVLHGVPHLLVCFWSIYVISRI